MSVCLSYQNGRPSVGTIGAVRPPPPNGRGAATKDFSSPTMASKETAHYVVTAHPPGAVLVTTKCNFVSEYSMDILIAKARRLEVRQYSMDKTAPSPLPLVVSVPINGRITAMKSFCLPSMTTSAVFLLTERLQYAVIIHDASLSPYPIRTLSSGTLQSGPDATLVGRVAETSPLVAIDPHNRCLVLHVYDGLVSMLPIHTDYQTVQYKDDTAPTRPLLGDVFHCRIEERTLLALEFLPTLGWPLLVVLHQDARGAQHVLSHVVNLERQQLHLFGSQSAPASTEWLKKTSIDGGSSLLIPVAPPPLTPAAASASLTETATTTGGGVVVVGQRQCTYCSAAVTKVLPVPQALFLSHAMLPPDPSGMPRYLLGDEFGNLHMLTLLTVGDKVVSLQFDTLGSCAISSSMEYLADGLVWIGSTLGDSQLIQVHDEPIPLEEEEEEVDLMDTTYLSVVEEYTHLGPILDFDLVPTTPGTSIEAGLLGQSQVVTASGSSKSGSLRLVRNGIGMNEYAAVELPGIQNMWSVRRHFGDAHDAYLVQSFVGETRVLGVSLSSSAAADESLSEEDSAEAGGTLEEVVLPGLEAAASTLYVGNVQGSDRILQITESQARLFSTQGVLLDSWAETITVACANEAGQFAVALPGGRLLYFCIEADQIKKVHEKQMDREVSCIDLNPFAAPDEVGSNAMEIDDDGGAAPKRVARRSNLMAVGLWDDFTVRLLSLDANLDEALRIKLTTDEEEEEADDSVGVDTQRRNRNNMMARSLSLVTLDFSSSGASAGSNAPGRGVDMLFVGLGDGTLISFAVVTKEDKVSVRSKKEVCLGTQRIDLIPLTTEQGGTCVLATGDRPTVIYLAGVGGASSNQFNPKLCYSNVNLSATDDEEGDDISRPPSQQTIAVNVAAPFFSPSLFDVTAMGNHHYSLCVADDSYLRLGVIDDIQKLHVTTCRLGMAPRRIVHCVDGRLFAVGCIESGIKHFGLGGDEGNMGNCIRFMDDTTFDDIERIDLEPFEMILSMSYATLRVPSSADGAAETLNAEGESSNAPVYQPFLLVGTAYALPDEDEPTRGRILVYSFQADDASASNATRVVRQVTELSVQGGVYSICQFYDGKVIATVNTKAQLCQLVDDTGFTKLQFVGTGHHGHILSLFVKSRATRMSLESRRAADASGASVHMDEGEKDGAGDKKQAGNKEMLAIVGDLMRSISLIQYYPEHDTLEEIARDFNSNWTTAIEMLNNTVYLGAENWNNLFCLRRNNASSEEVRCRLDTIGEYHLGELCNKFMLGSLVMPSNSSSKSSSKQRRRLASTSPSKKKTAASPAGKVSAGPQRALRRPVVVTGSQTLFGTVDGTLGVVLGLDERTAAFFSTLERAMASVVRPVADLSHSEFRACQAEGRKHPAHGFCDGDLVESFLDLDRTTMEGIVDEMNRDCGWTIDDDSVLRVENNESEDAAVNEQDRAELSVDDVLAMVEEMAMLH